MEISGSRVAHSFHALGVVDPACQDFLDAVKDYMAVSIRSTTPFRRKMDKVTMRSFQRIQMTIGRTRCKEDFFFTGVSVYLDNYFNAALWP